MPSAALCGWQCGRRARRARERVSELHVVEIRYPPGSGGALWRRHAKSSFSHSSDRVKNKAMDSGDEWCCVDYDGGGIEPESEVEPMVVEHCVIQLRDHDFTELRADDDDDDASIDVIGRLADSAPQPPTREANLSLLTPSHRQHVLFGDRGCQRIRKRPIREAFAAPSRRQHENSTFADRLRAAMPSRRAWSAQADTTELTEVMPITMDTGTQTDSDDSPSTSKRLGQLGAALDRTVLLSKELKETSARAELYELRSMGLCSASPSKESQLLHKQLDGIKRGLRISRQRTQLAEQYQSHLKSDVARLCQENADLRQRVEVLAGGFGLETKSIEELEALEDQLSEAAANVRRALRAKYRTAITTQSDMKPTAVLKTPSQQSPEHCVVCLEKLACVRLHPCGHVVLCSACSLRVGACPVDRSPIADMVLTFGLNAYIE